MQPFGAGYPEQFPLPVSAFSDVTEVLPRVSVQHPARLGSCPQLLNEKVRKITSEQRKQVPTIFGILELLNFGRQSLVLVCQRLDLGAQCGSFACLKWRYRSRRCDGRFLGRCVA